MKIVIDKEKGELTVKKDNQQQSLDLYSLEAFKIVAHEWLRLCWNQDYTYTFSWLGIPIIQLPDDMFRIQEVIYDLQPDLIIETGVAHGGSLIYYASLLHSIGKGHVVGIDIEITAMRRQAIEQHPLAQRVSLIEGDSVDPATLSKVESYVADKDIVLVILDSDHTKKHVQAELESYSKFVTPNSYIVAVDGFMKFLADVPQGNVEWEWDNPGEAAIEFVNRNPEFIIEQPTWPFNPSKLTENVTHWPNAWLKRK
jgi:cephalosporin hydroxylase